MQTYAIMTILMYSSNKRPITCESSHCSIKMGRQFITLQGGCWTNIPFRKAFFIHKKLRRSRKLIVPKCLGSYHRGWSSNFSVTGTWWLTCMERQQTWSSVIALTTLFNYKLITAWYWTFWTNKKLWISWLFVSSSRHAFLC